MALNAYLRLKGKTQGDIKGSVTQKGREGTIAVHAYHHKITSPRDPASGLATGKRQHGAFTIIKETDRSTPLLFSVLITNEALPTWELKCWTPRISASTGVGAEVNHFTIVLTNAMITGIESIMENNLQAEEANLPQMEEVTFAYQKIQWIWTDGNIITEDNWSA